MLRVFGFKPKASPAAIKAKLPSVNTFVDLAMTKGGPRGQVCVEGLAMKSFAVTAIPGIKPGMTGVFAYQTGSGKFRFASRCTAVTGTHATFELPDRVETLATFASAQKRSTVRLDATVPGRWRNVVKGKPTGAFFRGSLSDISRTGCSLVVDRELGRGTQVEVEVDLSGKRTLLLGEVMRASKIEASGKNSLGLKFHGVRPEDDRAIMDFINKRQAERRSRGLA